MRKVLIFLLILTIPIGLISGTTKAISAFADDVEITQENLYGDAGWIEGRQVQLMTTLNEHVWWLTDYTAGDPGVAETEFIFSQKARESEVYWDRESFHLYTGHGFGMSTSGSNGFQFSDEGIGRVFQAVADRAQPGETRTQEVLLEDYMDTYPMDFSGYIYTQRYWLEFHYDQIDGIQEAEVEDVQMYRRWMQLFRFPLLPGQKAEVTLTKDADGEVRDVNFSLIDGANAEFVTYTQDEGMYFSPSFRTWGNQPITTGEFVEGYGLYYIPFKPVDGIDMKLVEDDETLTGTFDFDNLELIYPLEPGEELVAMQASSDESDLQMLTLEEGTYYYCDLDLSTRKLTHRIPITQDDGQGCQYTFFPEQSLLYLKQEKEAALVNTAEEPKVEFLAPWPEDVAVAMPEDILYEDGTLYLTALDWTEGGDAFYLAALDEKGLGYCGYYYSNLKRTNTTGGDGYISMERIIFIE